MTKTGRIRKVDQFTTCKGVFQGGGCRGFAYVGAYKAAVDAGVVLLRYVEHQQAQSLQHL